MTQFKEANKKLWQLLEGEAKRLPPLTVRTGRELLNITLDPHDNLFGDRLLSKGGTLAIIGQGDIGKSRLILHLSAAFNLGTTFLGIETRVPQPCRILMLQTENSNRRLKTELQRLVKQHGDGEWLDQLIVHTIETDTDGLVGLEGEQLVRIEQLIQQTEPTIVIVDPFRDVGVGDLNTDVDMTFTCKTLKEIVSQGNVDRCLIVVHHSRTGRAGMMLRYDKSSFNRNSKVLFGWTRAQLNILPGTPTYDKLVIDCGKNNDGKQFEPFAVKLNLETMMYELDPGFNFEEWQKEIAGKADRNAGKAFTLDRLKAMEKVSLPYGKMIEAICDFLGCKSSKADKLLDAGTSENVFSYDRKTKLYTKRDDSNESI